MKFHSHWKTKLRLVLVAAALMVVAGCGSSEAELDCGDGTVEQDGVCLPDGEVDGVECGPGTELENGLCVVIEGEDLQCGDGTVQSNGTCVPAEDGVECGDGTDLVDGVCLPTGQEIQCGEGTELDEGLCVPIEGEDLQCGDGTVQSNGTCVPAEDGVQCGEGTELEDGFCVPTGDGPTCGSGTQLIDGTCVVATDGCAEGTELDESGVCIPSDTVCAEGTAFDAGLMQCVPLSSVTCGMGTVEVDEQCVPELTVAEELAAQADLDESQGSQIEVPAQAGDRFIVTGTIGEPDPDQQLGEFTFQAEAGQWLEVGVYSLGLPAPGFTVDGPSDYWRASPVGVTAKRQLFVPRDGEYTISVVPSILIADGSAGPLGDEDWGYVAYVETLEAPQAHSLVMDPEGVSLSGDTLDLVDNLYQVEGLDDGESIRVVQQELGANVDGLVKIWDQGASTVITTNLDEAFATLDALDEPFYLLVDFYTANGPSTHYELTLEPALVLEPGESVTTSVTLEAGEVVVVTQDNDESLDLFMELKKNGDILTESLVAPLSATYPTYRFWYSDEGGDYEVELTNTNEAESTKVQFSAEVREPIDLGILEDGGIVVAEDDSFVAIEDSVFHMVHLEEDMIISGMLTTSIGEAYFRAYETDPYSGSPAHSRDMAEGASTLTFEQVWTAGTYLVRVYAWWDLDEGYELQLSADAVPTEPFSYEEQFELSPGEVIEVRQFNGQWETLDVSIEKDGAVLLEDQLGPASDDRRNPFVKWYSDKGGTYTVIMEESDGPKATNYNPEVDIRSVTSLATVPGSGSVTVDEFVDIGENHYFLVNATDWVNLSGTLTADDDDDPDLFLYDAETMVQRVARVTFGGEEFSGFLVPQDRKVLLRVFAWTTLSEGFTLSVESETADVISLGSLSVGDSLLRTNEDAVASNDSRFYSITLTESVRLTGELAAIDGGDPDFFLYALSNLESSLYSVSVGGDIVVNSPVLDPGTYVIEVLAFSELSGGYTLELDAEAP